MKNGVRVDEPCFWAMSPKTGQTESGCRGDLAERVCRRRACRVRCNCIKMNSRRCDGARGRRKNARGRRRVDEVVGGEQFRHR